MMGLKSIDVFIIGSKGIPAKYGGFETFVDKLTEYKKSNLINYHVACAVEEKPAPSASEFTYHNAHCFRIAWRKKVGAARAIFYDSDALRWSLNYIRKNNIKLFIIYILTCRIGPYAAYYKRKINRLGGWLYINPDGHEWMREKWKPIVRKYWRYSEKLMVKQADLLICDSKNIKAYIQNEYKKFNPETTYISYGAETSNSVLGNEDPQFKSWLSEHKLLPNEYYLIVGRFVPENNYETMIREFMASDSKRNLVIITALTLGYFERLKTATGFDQDPRIQFVGTVFDRELLKKIRENAYGYFHGHEVGGTNPSLLEALASTNLNLLLDVGFNREVAEDGALYWNKQNGNLTDLINKAENMDDQEITKLGEMAKARIAGGYSWEYIVRRYEEVFINGV